MAVVIPNRAQVYPHYLLN